MEPVTVNLLDQEWAHDGLLSVFVHKLKIILTFFSGWEKFKRLFYDM